MWGTAIGAIQGNTWNLDYSTFRVPYSFGAGGCAAVLHRRRIYETHWSGAVPTAHAVGLRFMLGPDGLGFRGSRNGTS